ncbi:MAG: DUF1385 domain-containing protein [Clostridia bacterium]|nr:DUF1385 domain-containing protein [Clostridia bacterium]
MANEMKKTSIGGQALIEGIMMRGPERTAMAVRNPEGEIILEEWDTEQSKLPKICRFPFVRGIFNMIDSFRFGYKCLMRSAEIAGLEEEEKPKLDKNGNPKKSSGIIFNILMGLSAVLGVVLAIFLFVFLPSQLYSWISAAIPSLQNRVLRAVFEGLFRIVLFVGYMALVTLMKDIRRTFMYHGAEHKTIFCYEAGLPLTVENIRGQRRFHPRCGTSFMILVLIVGIIISMFITITNPFLRTLIKLLTLPIVVGIGYELIKLAGRHDNVITRIISMPGVWLQHITVLEPTDDMIECAIAAMNKVIPENSEMDKW